MMSVVRPLYHMLQRRLLFCDTSHQLVSCAHLSRLSALLLAPVGDQAGRFFLRQIKADFYLLIDWMVSRAQQQMHCCSAASRSADCSSILGAQNGLHFLEHIRWQHLFYLLLFGFQLRHSHITPCFLFWCCCLCW